MSDEAVFFSSCSYQDHSEEALKKKAEGENTGKEDESKDSTADSDETKKSQ